MATFRGGKPPLRSGVAGDDLDTIFNYLHDLDKQLTYMFGHLDDENFTDAYLSRLFPTVVEEDPEDAYSDLADNMPYGYRYASFGDSIAAGHAINADWEVNYGTGSQYGNNGNEETVVVPGCYTELIGSELVSEYGGRAVSMVSFAKSGERVRDLIDKLEDAPVKNALTKAHLITICIGANDVLEPAMHHLEEYINTGSLASIEAAIEENFTVLNDDSNGYSFRTLFNKLTAMSPNAKIVLTTVYNPYKYLWIEEGQNGFFGPVLNAIPQMTVVGLEIDELIKDGLLNTDAIRKIFDRVNGLDDWVERYVTRLNDLLQTKISAFGSSNILLAETKRVFDSVPDRPVSAPKHYNDLVNVEYTRGYNTATMDWGRLYDDAGGASNYWTSLVSRHVSNGFDLSGLATELAEDVVNKVIVPDIDPHPETYGQYAMKCAFADALGWDVLLRRTISFNANGGTGTMAAQTVIVLDGMTPYVTVPTNGFGIPSEGYYFNGWKDANGNVYNIGDAIPVTGDMVLYAQWSDLYNVYVHHSEDSTFHGSDDTGPMECYKLWIDGTPILDTDYGTGMLGAFSNPGRMLQLHYGSKVGVIVKVKSGDPRSYISLNGATIAGKSSEAAYTFTVTGNMDIHYEWNYWLENVIYAQSYWNCYVTT